MQYIVYYGDLVKGFVFIGPFDSKELAERWIEYQEYTLPNKIQIVALGHPA